MPLLIATATAEPPILGDSKQDRFRASYEDTVIDGSRKGSSLTNPEPANTQTNAWETSQANFEPAKMGENAFLALTNGAELATLKDNPPAIPPTNPEPTIMAADNSQTTSSTNPKPTMSESRQDTFHGWLATSPTSPLTNQPFHPKTWEETDVDIKVTHCGVCASDLHTMRSGWGETLYPVCCGHEIVGTAIRVGSKAREGIKVGDRVGVGPQGYNCHQKDCEVCLLGR